MFQTDRSDNRFRRVMAEGFLLGLLVLIVLVLALLALTIPEVIVELPVEPTITDYPISLRGGF